MSKVRWIYKPEEFKKNLKFKKIREVIETWLISNKEQVLSLIVVSFIFQNQIWYFLNLLTSLLLDGIVDCADLLLLGGEVEEVVAVVVVVFDFEVEIFVEVIVVEVVVSVSDLFLSSPSKKIIQIKSFTKLETKCESSKC